MVDWWPDAMADVRISGCSTSAQGSGCIAISLARVLKFAQIDAVDISKAALEVAAENARRLKAGVRFIEMDILSQTPPSAPVYDIIVSNPPYIALGEEPSMDRRVWVDHEPHRALFVPDSDPLVFYHAIAGYAAGALVPGGAALCRIEPVVCLQRWPVCSLRLVLPVWSYTVTIAGECASPMAVARRRAWR